MVLDSLEHSRKKARKSFKEHGLVTVTAFAFGSGAGVTVYQGTADAVGARSAGARVATGVGTGALTLAVSVYTATRMDGFRSMVITAFLLAAGLSAIGGSVLEALGIDIAPAMG